VLAEDAVGSREHYRSHASGINPALKQWLDNVLVPALVQQVRVEKRAVGDNDQDRISSTNPGTSTLE
jgi:hypothetical protein